MIKAEKNRLWIALKLSVCYAKLLARRRQIGMRLHWPRIFNNFTMTGVFEYELRYQRSLKILYPWLLSNVSGIAIAKGAQKSWESMCMIQKIIRN